VKNSWPRAYWIHGEKSSTADDGQREFDDRIGEATLLSEEREAEVGPLQSERNWLSPRN
jgi:hypothetical protein